MFEMRDSVASTTARLVRCSLLVLLGLVVTCKAQCAFSNYASNAMKINMNSCGLTTINKAELTRFTNLNILFLESNQFTTFPDLNAVGKTLKELRLYNNQITDISGDMLMGLTALEYLSLTYNRLTTFPNLTAVGNTLKDLRLFDNQITDISDDVLMGLTALEFLFLTNNQVTTFPNLTAVGNTLKKLNLKQNQITDISDDIITNLTALEVLSISGNPNLTRLPHPAHMRNVKILYIEDTRISHMPPILAENITTLQLYANRSMDVCKCNNAWLKQESPRISIFQYDDVECGGQLWSTMTIQDMIAKCSHQRKQETKQFARAKAVPPKMSLSPCLLHSFENKPNKIQCTEKCIDTPGCVSFYWRRAPSGAGDCVIIAPGNSISVSSVPEGNLPVWMYFPLT